jgi:hypothetical protein
MGEQLGLCEERRARLVVTDEVPSSLVFFPVADGDWGIGGTINLLPDFAAGAGYAHLQHLVAWRRPRTSSRRSTC